MHTISNTKWNLIISLHVAKDQYIWFLEDYYNANFKLKCLEDHDQFDIEKRFIDILISSIYTNKLNDEQVILDSVNVWLIINNNWLNLSP